MPLEGKAKEIFLARMARGRRKAERERELGEKAPRRRSSETERERSRAAKAGAKSRKKMTRRPSSETEAERSRAAKAGARHRRPSSETEAERSRAAKEGAEHRKRRRRKRERYEVIDGRGVEVETHGKRVRAVVLDPVKPKKKKKRVGASSFRKVHYQELNEALFGKRAKKGGISDLLR